MAIFRPLERTQVKPFLRVMSAIMFLSGAASVILAYSINGSNGLAFILTFIASAVQVVAGAMGFVGATKGAFISGLIVLFFVLAGIAMNFVIGIQTGDFSGVANAGGSFVIPLLFYISVVRNDR